jgi:hypothetical protein
MPTKRQLKHSIDELEERVKELERQLDYNLVERTVPDHNHPRYAMPYYHYKHGYQYDNPTKKVHELTIEGKVNALIEHLGLDVTVEQRKTTTTGPKIKTKKVTKKGKK